MTLHLVRLGIAPHALAVFSAARGVADDDDGYALHSALVERFGGGAPRPFRFLPDHRRGPHLLGYTADADALADAAALPAADALLQSVFTGPPEVQPMPAAWRAGARYAFELRARPVVRYGRTRRAERAARGGLWQRAGELDAWVAACERVAAAGGDVDAVTRDAVYADWLRDRLSGIATLDDVALRLVRRARTRRSPHHPRTDDAPARRRTTLVQGPDAVLGGTLTITDPDAFAGLLARGVGRHAAFGYGMLLLSAAGRPG